LLTSNHDQAVRTAHWRLGRRIGLGDPAGLVSASDCEKAVKMLDQDGIFRSRWVMTGHGFVQGEYRYFAPLPDEIEMIGTGLYPHLDYATP